MAGRFFQYRLHPLDLKEIRTLLKPESLDTALTTLMEIGGFPEPYLKDSKRLYNRWKRSHLDIILRQDLLDLENVRQISSIETLIQLLRKRVGSPLSYKSLAEDLQCSDKTVKRWLTMLETMYVIFRITPYHKNIAHFGKHFPGIKKVQIVKELKREKTFPDGVEIRDAGRWLSTISFRGSEVKR